MPVKPPKSNKGAGLERRRFLAGALTMGPAIGLAGAAHPATAQNAPQTPARSSVPERSLQAQETAKPDLSPFTITNPGSDFMVDVIKTLDFDYVAAVPGSSFRGLQESLLTYGNNSKPEWVTCFHEDSSVAIAHGYAKMSGKPMLVLVHGVVGLQRTPMAIYNAFCDQVPIVIIAGNTTDGATRRPNADWQHSALDQAAIVRDITKWDDQPNSIQGWSESMVRAYDIATTVPKAPVLIVSNGELMEHELPPPERRRLTIPPLRRRTPPAGETNAVRDAAKMLANAEYPVIIADRYCRSQQGMDLLVKLAETLQAPVIDKGARLNMPNRHPLCHTLGGGAHLRQADVILSLEPADPFGTFNDQPDVVDAKFTSRTKAGAKIITIGMSTTGITKSNFNDFMRYSISDLSISGDGEATLPSLIEEIARELSGPLKDRASTRGAKLADMGPRFRDAQRKAAAVGWDASPITTARTNMELWEQIKNEDWAAGALNDGMGGWPQSLWKLDKHYQHIGGMGGGGLGYFAAAAVGAALHNKKVGRITVATTGDGSFNGSPGVLWTAAQQKLPLLMILHNNRGYHQEVMHIQRMADQRSRPLPFGTGCSFDDPLPDYARLAKGHGCYAEGPITYPKDLGPAIKRALAVVKRGEPAFLDVVSQGR